MEREFSSVMHMGIAMVMIAAVIALLVPTLWAGRKLAYDYLGFAESMNADLTSGEFEYIKEREIEVPTAAVFGIIKANEDNVNELYLCNKGLFGVNSHDRLYDVTTGIKTDTYKKFEQNISAKVKIYTVWNSASNGYDIYLHSLRCAKDGIHEGSCE